MSTMIIPCPSCSRQLRMPNDRVIKTGCPSCGRKFKVDHGRVVEIFAANTTASGEQLTGYWKWLAEKGNPFYLRPWFLVGVPLVLLIAGLIFRNTIYEENSRYNALMENPTSAAADYFLDGFATSGRAGEVRALGDSLRFEEAAIAVNASCDDNLCRCLVLDAIKPQSLSPSQQERHLELSKSCAYQRITQTPDTTLIDRYFMRYLTLGDTVYLSKGMELRDSTIALQEAAFTEKIRKRRRGESFLNKALEYAAANDNRTIAVRFNQRKMIKDYDDYSEEVRQATDEMIATANKEGGGTSYPPVSQNKPASIAAFFNKNTDDLEKRLIKVLQSELDSHFRGRSLTLKRVTEDDDLGGIVLDVEYLISTLEDQIGFFQSVPSLYVWQTEMDRGLNDIPANLRDQITPEQMSMLAGLSFKGYLLATSIDWDLTMDYPGAPERVVYATTTRPQAEIKNVENRDRKSVV